MRSLSNAVGAKTARACDSCVKRRARWYCAADDAFLCQSCDNLVHSANPLARRHERVRLKMAVKHSNHSASPPHEAPTWHHGFTRKRRTPRSSSKKSHQSIFHDLVPEISAEDQTESYELEEQLICQVPVLDRMVSEQFLNDVVQPKIKFPMIRNGVTMDNRDEDEDNAESCLNGFFPTDMELEEFAADVETLLGHGLDTKSYSMEELGLSSSSEMFKTEKDEIEEEEEVDVERKANMGTCEDGSVTFELSFDDYESRRTYNKDVMKYVERSGSGEFIKVKKEEQKNVLMLKCDSRLGTDDGTNDGTNDGSTQCSAVPTFLGSWCTYYFGC